ncbi:hypothetical protein N7489_005410 [Penicillium chrysogenum]|uniref:uncharacterized protein n=1 Tax=Penicillium chrysogenum TaxID=5076 RepID=UPI0024DF0874|nr:uncharacterized protein N7489_005410 [Penicillium chrysogenum]KAJ5245314.1 hypothetical protein N7489_005410 [Penicillium chrysogenum]
MSWLKLHPLSSLDTASQAGPDSDGKTNESRDCSDTEPTYSNERASNRGHGTDDTLAVTRVLEQHGIPCCLVGIAALVFYGADRVRSDWEICVPTELVGQAAELLQSEPYATQYRLVKPWPYYSPLSLIHTYHRFKSRGINHYFFLVPSIDMHIDCDPSNFTRSPRGLPYPKLDVFIQSCLDTNDMLQLCDVIDGTNVSEEWGENNLDLEGTTDVEWAKEKNKRGEEFGGKWAHGLFAWEGGRNKREMWQSLVRTKEDRLDWTKPKDVFITQHRVIGTPDPWTELSDMS